MSHRLLLGRNTRDGRVSIRCWRLEIDAAFSGGGIAGDNRSPLAGNALLAWLHVREQEMAA
jgi:hypothetical protein